MFHVKHSGCACKRVCGRVNVGGMELGEWAGAKTREGWDQFSIFCPCSFSLLFVEMCDSSGSAAKTASIGRVELLERGFSQVGKDKLVGDFLRNKGLFVFHLASAPTSLIYEISGIGAKCGCYFRDGG